MRVFELYFNPKKRGDRVFESFVYEDCLCMAGEISRAMPQNSNFLGILSDTIKNEFSAKNDFNHALNEANVFLDQEVKSGNVNWLGNLNFAAVNIKDSILNFTKVGNIKILLLREDEVLDVSQNLELQDQEPYPSKVFSNTASGKLSSQDKILIATQEIFSVISKNENLLSQLSQVASEKELNRVFKLNKEVIANISGLCLLVSEGNAPARTAFPGIKFAPKIFSAKIVIMAVFIIVIMVGYFLFRETREEQPIPEQDNLIEVRSKIMMAENFLIMKKDEKAQALFQEAWDILQPIDTKEASSLRESIEKYINKK